MRKMYLRVSARVVMTCDDDVTIKDIEEALKVETVLDGYEYRMDVQDTQLLKVELEDSK